jgi:hypothetical protein
MLGPFCYIAASYPLARDADSPFCENLCRFCFETNLSGNMPSCVLCQNARFIAVFFYSFSLSAIC